MNIESYLETKKDFRDYHKAQEFMRLVEAHLSLEDKTVVDLCCGSGMLGFYFLQRHPEGFVYFVDINKTNRFREMAERVPFSEYEYVKQDIYEIDDIDELVKNDLNPFPVDVLLSIHACNELTDAVIKLGVQKKPFAVMTCCHTRESSQGYTDIIPPHVLSSLGLATYVDLGRVKKIKQSGRQGIIEKVGRQARKSNNVIISV